MTKFETPSEVFDFDGRPVRFGVIGDGDPLALVHGTPFSSVVWRRIAPYLAAHRRVYYYDLVGYGQSIGDVTERHDVSLGVQNILFTALLNYWGLTQPDVVAHDFGGATALRAKVLNGRNYRTLTLIDPVALSPSGSPLVQLARDNEEVFSQLPAYLHEAVLRAYIQGAANKPLTEIDLYMEPWLGPVGQAAFYRQIAQMHDRFTDEVQDRYAEVDCPVQILWGEQDSWIPLDRGHDLVNRIPGAKLHTIPDAAHLVQEDAPEAIVAHVLDFLAP
jgi:pimeloyl-ACP methyl ester carboxylesterase